MAKHAWIQEHLAAYLAGGLDAQESAQLEKHVASCPNCAKSLDEARSADQALTALFAGVLPEDGMEDRVMRRLPIRRPMPRYLWHMAAAAAILLVGFVGTMINSAIDKKELGFPDGGFALDGLFSRLGGIQVNRIEVSGGGGGAPWTTERMEEKYQFANDHRTPIMPPGPPRRAEIDASGKVASEGKQADGKSGMDGVSPQARFGKDGGVDVTYEITEKPKPKVGHISIAGNDVTRDNVSLRQVGPYPGQTLTYPDLPNGEKKLADLSKFEVDPSKGITKSIENAGSTEEFGVEIGLRNPVAFNRSVYPQTGQPAGTKSIKDQVVAVQGVLDFDGSITADLNGVNEKSYTPDYKFSAGWRSKNEPAKNDEYRAFGFLNDFGEKNKESGASSFATQTQEVASSTKGKLPGLQNSEDENADPFPPELQSALGYYPPSRALQVKGTSRLHTNLGTDPSIGRRTQTGGLMADDSKVQSSTNGPFNHFKPNDVALGGNGSPQTGIVNGIAGTAGGASGGVSGSTRADSMNMPPIQISGGTSTALIGPSTLQGGGISGGIGGGISGGIGGGIGGISGGSSALQTDQEKQMTQLRYGYLGRAVPIQQQQDFKGGTESAFDFGVDKPAVPANSVGKTSKQAEGKPEKEPQTAPAKAATPPAAQLPAAQPAVRKVIIRTGEMEFEIEAFDAATAIINRLVDSIPGGFVATTNSEKLPNGKVRGSVVVRTPPEHLDALVSNLRKELSKGGELKSQRIGSQDITKQFTDLESRLRAARTMEERLLQIIKAGKGEIKDLLNVEKELGIWRTKIEEMEGELRFFAHQVSLSTLTITLAEKEIRAPYGVLETERTNMGIEVEDVEKAQVRTLAIVADVKGRITKSELKQMDAGQYNAVINFEVPPDAAGPVRDRLKQLGNLARYDVNRLLEAEGGTGKPQDAKVTKHDAQFFLSLYNLANVAPRETTSFDVATPDAEAAYKALLTRVQTLGGRIVTWNLNRQNNDQTVGTISFQVKTAEADALIAELKALGETLRHQTTESADTQNTTKSKRGFLVQIMAFGAVPARETTALQLAAPDVSASYRKLQEAIAASKGRMLSAQLNEQNRQNTSAVLDFEVRREEESAIRSALAAQGDVLSRNVTRVPENENAISSKVRLHVALVDAARIPPRETTTLEIEPADVDAAATMFTSIVRDQGGRTVESHVSRERNGRATSKLVFNVPLAAAAEVIDKFKTSGVVRVQDKVRNPQVPDGPLAVARIEVTLSNSDLIVPSDQGLWPQVRKGLSTSFVGLSWSLTVVIIGILFVLPWVLAIYAGFRVVRWMRGAPRGA